MSEIIKKGKKFKLFGIVFFLVVAIGLIFKFGPSSANNEDETKETEKPTAYVETVVLGEKESNAAMLERTAVFSSSAAGDVIAESTGRIRKINFEIGDFVRKGQILASFDQSSSKSTAVTALNSAQMGVQISLDNQSKTKKVAKESLELAKNARKIAQMQYENAKDDSEVDTGIARRAYENAKDLEEQAEENVKIQKNQAQLQVNQSQVALDGARVMLETTILRAPVSGAVVLKNVEIDEYVSAGTRVAAIVGEGVLETTISLNSDQITRVKKGDAVGIELDGKSYQAEIVSLSSIAKTTNQRFDIKIQSKEKLSLNANKTGKVFLSLSLKEGEDTLEETVFFAPIAAVNLGQRRSVVFIFEEGRANIREVKTGELVGTKIELVEGVSEGEELIILNSRNLQDGQAVTKQK